MCAYGFRVAWPAKTKYDEQCEQTYHLNATVDLRKYAYDPDVLAATIQNTHDSFTGALLRPGPPVRTPDGQCGGFGLGKVNISSKQLLDVEKGFINFFGTVVDGGDNQYDIATNAKHFESRSGDWSEANVQATILSK